MGRIKDSSIKDVVKNPNKSSVAQELIHHDHHLDVKNSRIKHEAVETVKLEVDKIPEFKESKAPRFKEDDENFVVRLRPYEEKESTPCKNFKSYEPKNLDNLNQPTYAIVPNPDSQFESSQLKDIAHLNKNVHVAIKQPEVPLTKQLEQQPYPKGLDESLAAFVRSTNSNKIIASPEKSALVPFEKLKEPLALPVNFNSQMKLNSPVKLNKTNLEQHLPVKLGDQVNQLAERPWTHQPRQKFSYINDYIFYQAKELGIKIEEDKKLEFIQLVQENIRLKCATKFGDLDPNCRAIGLSDTAGIHSQADALVINPSLNSYYTVQFKFRCEDSLGVDSINKSVLLNKKVNEYSMAYADSAVLEKQLDHLHMAMPGQTLLPSVTLNDFSPLTASLGDPDPGGVIMSCLLDMANKPLRQKYDAYEDHYKEKFKQESNLYGSKQHHQAVIDKDYDELVKSSIKSDENTVFTIEKTIEANPDIHPGLCSQYVIKPRCDFNDNFTPLAAKNDKCAKVSDFKYHLRDNLKKDVPSDELNKSMDPTKDDPTDDSTNDSYD